MKLRILDRIITALAGLVLIVSAAALAAQLFFGKDVVGYAKRLLENDSMRLLLIAGGVILCLLGLYCVMILFRHRGRNDKFISQKTDAGELSISLKALESMVTKCLEQHHEITAQGIHLENQKGSLLIRIKGTVAGGVSIPLTVDTLQQQIKQYVTACSGVEVKEIKVQIDSSGEDAKDAPFAISAPASPALLKAAAEKTEKTEKQNHAADSPEASSENPPAVSPEPPVMPDRAEVNSAAAAAAALLEEVPPEDDDRPVHQRLFSTVEEPCVMPMPPVEENQEQTCSDQEQSEGSDQKSEKDSSAESDDKEEIRPDTIPES